MMFKLKSVNILAIGAILFNTNASAQGFEQKTTKASDVRMNVTNIGTFGNAFRGYRDGSNDQSAEYTANSGVEHLFESGIWFGAVDAASGQTFVSTAAIDASSGYSTGKAGFEFSADPNSNMKERSSIFSSPNYSNQAVSHQDFVSQFTDQYIVVPGTNIPINGHTDPMFLDASMEVYNWNYTFSNFFVIANVKIVNNSNSTYDSAYFALYANTVVRNINVTPAGSGGSAFYNKGGNGFNDSLYMSYCYDKAGDVGFTDSYVSQKVLGAQDKYGFHYPYMDSIYNLQTEQWEYNTNFKCHYNAWEFNSTADPLFFSPGDDNQRYAKMSFGLNDYPCWDEMGSSNPFCGNYGSSTIQDDLNTAGNRSDLIAIGPFNNFAPGDTITIAYAWVFGKSTPDGNPASDNTEAQKAELYEHASWAQTTFNGEDKNFNGILDPGEDLNGDGKLTRYILPAPPEIPQTRIDAKDNAIDIYWSDNSEFSIDPITQEQDFEGYRIYMSKFGFDVTQVPPKLEFVEAGQWDVPANGLFFDTDFDSIRLDEPVTFEGDSVTYYYKYTVNNIANGWQYAIAVSAFDRGNDEQNLESLESSPTANNYRVFPGKDPNADIEKDAPFVYPNPYYAGAAWEGTSNFQEESRKIIFANLPANCEVRVFTAAGDFIDSFQHNQEYDGSDIRWFETFGAENTDENKFSGGEHAWDMISADYQGIARGIYIFTVEDLDTGEMKSGKFIVIK